MLSRYNEPFYLYIMFWNQMLNKYRRFSGKESFSHVLTAHGVDAGTGLGIISIGTETGN